MWLNSHLLSVFVPFTVLLNPVVNCSKSFMLFSLDKLTTGTYSFVSVILAVTADGATIALLLPYQLKQFFDQVN